MTPPYPIGTVLLAVDKYNIWQVEIRSVHTAPEGWTYNAFHFSDHQLISPKGLFVKAVQKHPPLRVLKNV